MIVPPGRRRPSRSAASTIRIATRSLIDPPGLKYSTLATICGAHPAPIRLSRTSGVSPTVSRSESLISVMAATLRRGCRWRGLVAGLAAGQLGLLQPALLDELRERVVGDRARDLGDVGDLRGADAGALADEADDRLAVGAARGARAGLARGGALGRRPRGLGERRPLQRRADLLALAYERLVRRELALDVLQPSFKIPSQPGDHVAHSSPFHPPEKSAPEGIDTQKTSQFADEFDLGRGRTSRRSA